MKKYIQVILLLGLVHSTCTLWGMEQLLDIYSYYTKKPATEEQKIQLNNAIRVGDIATIKTLVDQEIYEATKLNEQGLTPLEQAYNNRLITTVINGTSLDLEKVLADGGFQIDARDKDGSTPLQIAARLGKGSMVELLIKRGANIEAENPYGQRALHIAAFYNPEYATYSKDDIDPIDPLLRAGADVHAKSKASTSRSEEFLRNFSVTPLFFAIEGGYIPHIQKLVEAGALPTDILSEGVTALQYAIGRAYGADIFNALVFSVTPEEIKHFAPAIIALLKRKVIGGSKDAGMLVVKKLFTSLEADKIALARKYNPTISQEELQHGLVLLRQSFNRLWKKNLVMQNEPVLNVQNNNNAVEVMDTGDNLEYPLPEEIIPD